jgi:diguanylate cyclase (GGDEF)-like protein
MRVVMQRKSVVRQRPTEDLNTQILRLSRQNAVLRKEVTRLQIYRSMAYRDPLTGLWNRRYFEERLSEEFSRSQRAGSERRFSVLVVDINDFKTINDEHGHPVGDAVLKWAGSFLVTHLRTHDVPCRSGGDEFAVLLPDVSLEDAARLVTRLREQLARENTSRDIPVGLSVGTATWPDVGTSCADLIAHADDEMYEDKRRQRAAREAVAPRRGELATKMNGAAREKTTGATRAFRAARTRSHLPIA